MAAFAGIGASASASSVVINEASKWTLSMKNATKDATPFGATGNWAVNVPTINSWTAKITAFIDSADTEQVTLFNALGTTVPITLTVGNTHAFSGSAILSGIDPNVDAQNVETVDLSFTGTGAVTYA
jgi:hypothetical protein